MPIGCSKRLLVCAGAGCIAPLLLPRPAARPQVVGPVHEHVGYPLAKKKHSLEYLRVSVGGGWVYVPAALRVGGKVGP
jgi:hypothetical protein